MALRKAYAWLAEHEHNLPPEQRKRFVDFYASVADLDDEQRQTALMAAALYLAGDINPHLAGQALAHHRSETAQCYTVARTVGRLAVESGEPETQVAEALGVDRMTLRKWLGKR